MIIEEKVTMIYNVKVLDIFSGKYGVSLFRRKLARTW